MKNIENDVSNNLRNLIDIIDSDLRLRSSSFVVLTSSLRLEKDELIDKKIDAVLEYSQARKMIVILNEESIFDRSLKQKRRNSC